MNFDKPLDQSTAKIDPIKDGWTLAFEDQFDREEVGDDWQVLSGKFRIVDGMLEGDNLANSSSAKTVYLRDFKASSVRLEYDAVTGLPVDMSAMICTDNVGWGWNYGYFFGFGSDNNLTGKLYRLGAETTFYDASVTPGKVHKVVCQIEDGTLTHIIDGKVVMIYNDPTPLKGEGHEKIGLYIYKKGRMDNVKVYTKPE